MNTKVKIVRALWANAGSTHVFKEIPKLPTIKNQVVYVWGEDLESYIRGLGYDTRLVEHSLFSEEHNTEYGRKLVALDLAVQEFGEVLLLDWDCHILRPFEGKFYDYLLSKETQCPLYAQHKNTSEAFFEAFPNKRDEPFFPEFAKTMEINFNKYSWKMGDDLITPNFCCVYTRDPKFAKALIDIAVDNKIKGCVEEHAMWIYANCSLDEYIERHQPHFVQGVSDDMTNHNLMICRTQKRLNAYVSEKINMDLYLKHI